jgi:hypothetical protein
MPLIGGRYYANALAGHAIEAAREAEAALLALKKKSAQRGSASTSGVADAQMDSGDAGDEGASSNPVRQDDAPIHRVEIEAAELVPSHTGRAQRGFVARVHRDPSPAGDDVSGSAGSRTRLPGQLPSRGYVPKPETHVFAGHSDLLDFLKTELGKNAAAR